MLKSAILSLFSTWVLPHILNSVFRFDSFFMDPLDFFLFKNAILNVLECILLGTFPQVSIWRCLASTNSPQSPGSYHFISLDVVYTTLPYLCLSFLFKIQFS